MKKYLVYIAALTFVSCVFIAHSKPEVDAQTISPEESSLSSSTTPTSTPLLSPNLPSTISPTLSSRPPQAEKTLYLTLDMDMSVHMKNRMQDHSIDMWYDPALFDFLSAQHVPVTFFVSGMFVEQYPDLMHSLIQHPEYSFQNHAYDESGFASPCYHLHILTTDQEKIDQIKQTQDILTNLTGVAPTYFRFPGICHTGHDDDLIQKLGYKLDDGTIAPSDPFNYNTQAMINHTLAEAKDGGVIIMHIGGPNAPKSLEVVQKIIPTLREEGYIFKKLPGL